MSIRYKLLVFFLCLSTFAMGQIPLPRGSAAITAQDVNLHVMNNFKIPTAVDTAHALKGLDSLGLLVMIRSTGEVYKRDTVTGGHKWTLIGGGGSGTDSAIAAQFGMKLIIIGTTRYLMVDSNLVLSHNRGIKLADSLSAVFNALLLLKVNKSDSAGPGYATFNRLKKVADSLAALLSGSDTTIFRATGVTGQVPFYPSTVGGITTLSFPKYRDTSSAGIALAPDSVITIPTHDTTSANALESQYRADTALINRIAALALKLNIADSAGSGYATFLRLKKVADSLALLINKKVNISDSAGTGYATFNRLKKVADSLGLLITSGGASPANPSATIGYAAVNGTAPTFMRSDAAPPVDTSSGVNSLKKAFLPLRFEAAKTVNQGGNSVYFTGGGAHQFDSVKMVANLPLNPGISAAAYAFFVGDSFTFGLQASPITKAYPYLFAGYLGIPAVDSGVSSTTFPGIAAMVLRNINYPNTAIVSTMGGFNNFRSTNITLGANRKTLNMCIQGYKAVWMNANMKAPQSATSGTGVTRTGTWSTGYNCQVNSFGKTTNGAFNSASGATISYAFTDSTVCALLEVPVTSSSNLTVEIDGVTIQTLSLTGWSDISYGHYSIIITGLSFAAHTLRLTNVSGGLWIADCFSNLIPSAGALANIFWEVPKMNTTGYAGGTYSDAAADLFNGVLDSLAAALPPAYTTYVVKTNNTFNVHTGVASDSIHPNNTGHYQLFSGAVNALSASSPISDGTIITRKNANGSVAGYYGQKNGLPGQFPFITDIGLQTAIGNNGVIAGDFTVQSSTNNSFGWEGFGNLDFDSLFSINKATKITTVRQFSTIGAAAGINFLSRDGDTTAGFTKYAQSLKFRTYSTQIGNDLTTQDTAFHNVFYAEKSQSGTFAAKTHASISVMGNYNGAAGHTPLKLWPGPLVITKEPMAWEIPLGGLYVLWTDTTLVRDTVAFRAWARATFATIAGGSSYYQTVQSNTSSQTQRAKLNFGTDFTLSDNSGNGSTDVALAATVVRNVNWVDMTGATSYGTIATYAVPADGSYEVGAYLLINSISIDQVKITVTFTDHTNTSRSFDMFPSGTTAALVTLTGYYPYSPIVIKAKSGTNIVMSSGGTTGGSINFDVGTNINKIR